MDHKKICVIGATTDPDQMPRPLRDRFTMKEEFLAYGAEELARIVVKASKNPISTKAAAAIAKASLGVPRCALSLLAATEDQRIVAKVRQISESLVNQTLSKRGISACGLGPRHRETLQILKHSSRPIGLSRLVGKMGIESKVFRTTVEPELLKLGLIDVTPFGLIAV